MKIPRPQGNYIMIEELVEDSDENIIHIINFNESIQVKVGRSFEADLKINDISVSRNHAVLKGDKKGIYIMDTGSKFGTLVQINRGIVLDKTNIFKV
jgi:pSer/pThr/pTyr-binding forkhead associated (FHA) protein|mmetsp:Transcript_35490/g.6396  ORF Transcript_35490/g.6396 Transcript_35490/m.6396 type:complete len:97 (-) Transcript_35490:16-306(-)